MGDKGRRWTGLLSADVLAQTFKIASTADEFSSRIDYIIECRLIMDKTIVRRQTIPFTNL
jgi:hypothetical protein